MLGKRKSLVGTHEAHEIQAAVVLFWPQQPDATSRLGPDLVPSSRPVRADDEKCQWENEKRHMFLSRILRQVNRLHLTFLLLQLNWKIQTQTMSTRRITFKRLPNPVDRAEPPKRTRGDDDEVSAHLSACQHDLEKISENMKDSRGVVSGTGMPDMSDSARLAIETKTKTQKSVPTTDA